MSGGLSKEPEVTPIMSRKMESLRENSLGRPVIPALRRWRQEHQQFKIILGYLGELQARLGYMDPASKHNLKQAKTIKQTKAQRLVESP